MFLAPGDEFRATEIHAPSGDGGRAAVLARAGESAPGEGNLCKSRFTEKKECPGWRVLIPVLWEMTRAASR